MNTFSRNHSTEQVPAIAPTHAADNEPAFDEIVQLAAQISGAPIALITLVHNGQPSLKAIHGITASTPLPPDRSFCDYVLAEGGRELILPDTANDDRFQKSSCAIGADRIRFYAGQPLRSPTGEVLGTLCVMDTVPHLLQPQQLSALRILSHQVVTQLQLQQTLELRRKETEQLTLMAQALNASTDSIVITDARLPDNPLILVNPAFERITGYSPAESLGRNCRFLLNDEKNQPALTILRTAIRKRQSCRVILRNFRKDGRPFWNELHIAPVRDAAGETSHFIGILSDITARKETDDAVRQRDIILEGVSFAAESLLNQPDLGIALPAVLERIGIATASDHVGLWQSTPTGMHRMQLWAEPSLPSNNREYLQGMSWDFAHGWPQPDQLRLGRVVHAHSTEASPEEKLLLQRHNVRTLLFLPVFSEQGVLWGALTLGSANTSIVWGFAEIEALRSATRVLGAVIHDRETGAALRESKQVILSSLKEKEVLLKEIHHRVKNNMQIVSSLLNLQLESLQDEKSRTLFMEAQNRIASMALVHEKLYQSDDLASINFTDYLRELTDNLASMLGARMRNIAFRLETADLRLGIDTAIPCGLIINELVSNAYKHGYPHGGPGRVSLSFKQLPDSRLHLEVVDDGRGIPPGFDLSRTKSLGMQLVHTLVRQLHGTIEIQGPPGARFILHLKENLRKGPHRS